jgi:hypothetical protein
MNLSKFIKGTTTIGELENLPNRYIQVIYKEYVETLKNEEKSKAKAAEEISEQIEEDMGG